MFNSPGSRFSRRRWTSTSISILDSITGTFNGSTTSFNLTLNNIAYVPIAAQNLLVVLGGVIQAPVTDYTISGSKITFIVAPNTNETCNIRSIL